MYTYLSMLQGRCIPTLLDYVEFRIFSPSPHLPYREDQRKVGWDYGVMPAREVTEEYYTFQAFAMVLKEVAVQLCAWPAFSKSEMAIAAIMEPFAIACNEVLSCLGDSSLFSSWTRFAPRNILWYSPAESSIGKVLLIDLGKWEMPKSHLDPSKWCSRDCARRSRAVQDCLAATRKKLLTECANKHDLKKMDEYCDFGKLGILETSQELRQSHHDSDHNLESALSDCGESKPVEVAQSSVNIPF